MKNNYSPILNLRISLNFGANKFYVGKLGIRDKKIFFEYDKVFRDQKMNISPIHLPLSPNLFSFDPFLFDGLPGVFNDSLPDGWGRLLLDRHLRTLEINPSYFTVLDRLAHVGEHGMGALIYEPDYSESQPNHVLDLDSLSRHVELILEGSGVEFFRELLALNGSSAGARPKAMIGVSENKKSIIYGVNKLKKEYQHWLVKFANSSEGDDAGAIEYVYSQMAKLAGIDMMETYLFPSDHSLGYFATKRFDRNQNKRIHMHTASGLLHSDFRIPSLDYEGLIRLTMFLTKNLDEAKKMLQMAIFNVMAHNRDDHAKNFSFLMNEQGKWSLSPAYDLTFSSGPGGEQSTMVMGKGKDITRDDLHALGKIIKVSALEVDAIINRVENALSMWEKFAVEAGIKKEVISEIKSQFVLF